MKAYSAKQLHENPSEVYRAANRGPVVITHRHHGEMVLMSSDALINAMQTLEDDRGMARTLDTEAAIKMISYDGGLA